MVHAHSRHCLYCLGVCSLQLTLYRLFAESTEVPKQLRMDQVKAAFPHLSENVIRKRLKLFANFERFGSEFSNYGCWMLRQDFRLPSEEELRDLVTPEQFSAHASMKEAEQRLKVGWGWMCAGIPPCGVLWVGIPLVVCWVGSVRGDCGCARAVVWVWT